MLTGPILQSPLTYGDRSVVVDFKVMRKVSEKAMRTKQFQDELLNQLTELLANNLATYAYSISFPELSTFATKNIQTFLARMGDSANSNHIAQLSAAIEQNALFIRKLRDKTDKAPKEVSNSLQTFFAPNLKNSDKAPLALFLAKFNKQVEKWEAIINDKRVKLGKLENYDSDNDEDSENANGTAAEAEDDDEEGEEDEESQAKKEKREQNKKKRERKQEKKRKTPEKLAKLGKYNEDVTGDLVLSDDEEKKKEPRRKKAKTETNKPAQNGNAEKSKQKSKPQNGKAHAKPQNKGKK